mmetsp:Transcript_3952/g.9792  ORF Transcript_3952/g.9792 Transcript_3952/m.9792 type:complete len:80 (+) Transcript_3952:857-1096(+)
MCSRIAKYRALLSHDAIRYDDFPDERLFSLSSIEREATLAKNAMQIANRQAFKFCQSSFCRDVFVVLLEASYGSFDRCA